MLIDASFSYFTTTRLIDRKPSRPAEVSKIIKNTDRVFDKVDKLVEKNI